MAQVPCQQLQHEPLGAAVGGPRGPQQCWDLAGGCEPQPGVEILHQIPPVPHRGPSRGPSQCPALSDTAPGPAAPLLIPRDGPIPGGIPVPLPTHGTLRYTAGPATSLCSTQIPSLFLLEILSVLQELFDAFFYFLQSLEACLSLLGYTRNLYLMRMSQTITTRRWEVKGTGFISNRVKELINLQRIIDVLGQQGRKG